MTSVPSRDAPPALALRDIRVRYGPRLVLDLDEMTIPSGSVVGIVGANGSGKTTVLDVISGFVKPETGTVLLDGRVELLRRRPGARVALGVSRSFQIPSLFPSLSVAETVRVAFQPRWGTSGFVGSALGLPLQRSRERRIVRAADDLIDRMGLGDFYDKTIAELSTGTRRIVDLVCALGQNPSVLLLDEPGAGVAQSEVEALGRFILQIRETLGCTLVVIEHDVPLLRRLSDLMYALGVGRVLCSGDPDTVLSDPAVVASYLGTDEVAIARSGAAVRRPVGTGEIS